MANITENLMDHTLRRSNLVLNWIQVEGNDFGLDPNGKRELYNWIILGLDELWGHMDGSMSHWARMWVRSPQGANSKGLKVTWMATPL